MIAASHMMKVELAHFLRSRAILEILGAEGEEMIMSGISNADVQDRAQSVFWRQLVSAVRSENEPDVRESQ